MISNQILQETINGMKEVTGIDLCILDLSGRIVVTTMEITDALAQHAEEFADSMAESQVIDGFQYFKIFDDQRLEYILLATGMSENAYTVGKLAVMQIQNLLTAYKERLDKENFVKNLLRDNLLLVDIYNRSKKLHIEVEQRRVAFLIQAEYEKDQNLLEATKEVESGADSDFITAVDEKSIVYVTPVNGNEGQAQFIQHAKEIKEGLNEYGIKDAKIAIGNVAETIKDVSRSYKEAQIALEVSKIFYEDASVIAYNQLGIGRLIYQLPLPLCKMFIREVFGDYSPDSIDEETLATIDKFFENNLNVSETSRQLFIHRNTLVYRLDKIQKNTNLDLRNFEDAIAFKIALMVVKYMKHMDTMDYNMMITLKNVTKEYNKGNIGLEDVSLDIAKGEFVFIVGKSGSGKTTLMKLLQKELDVTSGQIIVNGQDYKKLTQRNLPKFRRQMGMVFQDFRLLKDRTIFENVAFAQQVVEVPHRYIKRQVENMLEMVGLKDRMNAFPNELSGGEQQRVAIARALVNHPVLLLADEPTGNLDPVTAKEIMELLSEINKSGTTVLVVTHNKELVNEMGKRVILIEDGHIEQDEIRGSYDI